MANLTKDTFTDTAGVSLDSHTPDTGAIWVFAGLSDSFRISDSEAAAYAESIGAGAATSDVNPTNYTVSVTIDTANFHVITQQAGVVARFSGQPSGGYRAVVHYDGTNFQVKLIRTDDSIDTTLVTSSNISTGSGIISLQVNGTKIGPVKWKGSQVIAQQTDATYIGGEPGISSNFFTSSLIDFFDNYLVVGTGTVVAPKPKRVKVRLFEHHKTKAHRLLLYAPKWVPRQAPVVGGATRRFLTTLGVS